MINGRRPEVECFWWLTLLLESVVFRGPVKWKDLPAASVIADAVLPGGRWIWGCTAWSWQCNDAILDALLLEGRSSLLSTGTAWEQAKALEAAKMQHGSTTGQPMYCLLSLVSR